MIKSVAILKRTFDLVVSVGLMGFLSPLLLFIAAAIKTTSKGPILYTQPRVGRHKGDESPEDHHTFNLFKFRTMVQDAEKATGAILQQANDPRIIPFPGRLLRRTRLDELPNFINVIKGDMSIIGPRADRLELLKQMSSYLPLILDRTKWVKPGITGLAQVKLRYDGGVSGDEDIVALLPDSDIEIPETVTSKYKSYYDFAYVASTGNLKDFLKMECYIIFQTPITMFIKKNPQ